MKPASLWDWLGPFILMAVLITYLYVSTDSQIIVCGGENLCFREWLSALSGWIAAVAAFVAAWLTLGPLLNQVREAKRQSDFLVGDEEPEFVLLRNREKNTVKLRVTNWNRRNVLIEKIECTEPTSYKVTDIIPTKPRSPQRDNEKSTNFLMTGWFDRAKAPDRRDLLLGFSSFDAPILDVGSKGTALRLVVKYRVIGQVHERRTSTVSAIDIADE